MTGSASRPASLGLQKAGAVSAPYVLGVQVVSSVLIFPLEYIYIYISGGWKNGVKYPVHKELRSSISSNININSKIVQIA